jgi:hypothetical protein
MKHLLSGRALFFFYTAQASRWHELNWQEKGLGSQLQGSKVIIHLKTAVETR